ncbi:hypothetical protein F383_19423 [Gossypium arboreum]|uniref:Uncharacterized protein n=1 Tax=Gossypium arboreum TaxID=29729 RepID=A0A0B0NQJ1_GOSAR|nr:hypothetical protein F383_19423 [Gossypium arboreum]
MWHLCANFLCIRIIFRMCSTGKILVKWKNSRDDSD